MMEGMIGKLSGTISELTDSTLLLETGGVGYVVHISPDTAAELSNQTEASLWTHLAVRENSLDLYGFLDQTTLHFFTLLITISGVGPKSALAILSVASVEELKEAVRENNPSYLTQVSGVGKKSAQKIVLELKDKIGDTSDTGDTTLKDNTEAIEALRSLGYSTQEARETLRNIPREITETSERIREALKKLGS